MLVYYGAKSRIFREWWRYLLGYGVFATVVCVAYILLEWRWLSITFVAVGTLGTALAIFLGFRNREAYDRWWESRKLWGMLVNYSRSFARQTGTFLSHADESKRSQSAAVAREVVYRHIAFVHALRLRLRRQTDWESLRPWLTADELDRVKSSRNVPNLLLHQQGVRLRQAREEGLLDLFALIQFDRTLCEFANVQGGCERIKNTPFPLEYDFYTDIFVQVFCLLLPFGLVDSADWWTIPLTIVVSYIFTVIDVVGEKYEDPFENTPQDTPLSAISRLIEVDLREQLGEKDLPELLVPVDGCQM